MENPETPSLPRGLFTSCPNCVQQFRIQAAQLSLADGQVKCGACGHQFSALPRLSDSPLTLDQINHEFDYEPEPNEGQEVEFDASDPGNESAAIPEVVMDEAALLSGLPDDLPEELRQIIPAKRSLFARISLSLGAVLLLIIILVQLAWFNRDQLLIRYPQMEPFAREVCERFDCELLRYKDIGAIKLLNRDVRNHPLYEGSLLVNATMANQSETIQPFPMIQLALFNTGGKVIAYREFKPAEYLDDSINVQAGMMPGSPIHFVLEVGGPTKDAVSFEFHFH